MKAKEYLDKTGFNEDYNISSEQVCRLLDGFNKHCNKKIISSIKGELSVTKSFRNGDFNSGKRKGLLIALDLLER